MLQVLESLFVIVNVISYIYIYSLEVLEQNPENDKRKIERASYRSIVSRITLSTKFNIYV